MSKDLQQRFKELILKNQNTLEFKLEELLYDITESLYRRMEELGINQHKLATQLGVSDAYISRVLKGHENISLKTLVKIAMALELDLKIDFQPKEIKHFRQVNLPSKQWRKYEKPSFTKFNNDLYIAA